MELTANCPLAIELAERIRANNRDLAERWLERIAARVSIEPNSVFPSRELLDHVPVLIDGIADYVGNPSDEISADMPVVAKAMELGALRLAQGFDAHEILREYELLGGILYNFAAREVEGLTTPCSHAELIVFSHRLFRAIAFIEQVTTNQYLRELGERVNQREEQLRRFNRMVSHELKNKVGAVLGAGELINEQWVSPDEKQKFVNIVINNAQALQQLLDNLVELSRLDADARRQRNIRLPEAVAEVLRQLRELARSRGVEVEVEEPLPRVEVNAATVELSLSNFLSNAIKYCDPAKAERWVRVSARLEQDEKSGNCDLTVYVKDNGVGVPTDMRERLFQRFFRVEDTADQAEGHGLGLSLVRETLESVGGLAWAEFPQEGSVFCFRLPCRRRSEAMTSDMVFRRRSNRGLSPAPD
ncbi:MAG TPA: sensor histidine kinase [Longimicrobiales bacterium]|nr:sensor histidine kinase [Longimicrobiales bacterium]